MPSKADLKRVDESIGIRIEGELDDFQIVEEESDSDDDDNKIVKSSRMVDTLSAIPPNLTKPSYSPTVTGNVAVSHSENVVIGHNTYFNGPVIIKQVIQNTHGLENPAYEQTEKEESTTEKENQESKLNLAIKRFQLQQWHKITVSAVCVILIGSIVAILSVIFSHSKNEEGLHSAAVDNNIDYSKTTYLSMVVGFYYDNLHLIIFTTILMPLTFLLWLLYTVQLTKNAKRDTISEYFDPLSKPERKVNPLIIAPDHLRIVSRTDWLAQPAEDKLDKIRQPVPWVIISHTATDSCTTQSECMLRVRLIQMFHIESRKWDDIGYNFLVAGDGSAYFGRGWDYIGAHTLGYNRYSIGISFIGTFNNEPPPKQQIDACLKLLKKGVATGKLDKDYKLFAHRQLSSTLSPGDKLYDIIKEWPHFVRNFTDVSELLPNY